MKKIKYFIIAILITFISFTVVPVTEVSAVSSKTKTTLTEPVGGNILPGGDILSSADIKSSFVFAKLIPFVIKYAIRLAIALSVIALIFGGYQFMTAYGDEEKHKTAQKTITFALIGLILAITAFGIVTIITNLRIT